MFYLPTLIEMFLLVGESRGYFCSVYFGHCNVIWHISFKGSARIFLVPSRSSQIGFVVCLLLALIYSFLECSFKGFQSSVSRVAHKRDTPPLMLCTCEMIYTNQNRPFIIYS
ncbi:hypothetical protein O6H91_02G023300 [Diphasiastrum complanatum]|uniref:Uncharacterized protein n=1 Tax=Diphasiastrum complanatum TaxID=34168 RepID=A0ACC2EE22_DIPCM|nr:hypothetical protein O6H91_02G023300 [Diphasiastrum complanatum]